MLEDVPAPSAPQQDLPSGVLGEDWSHRLSRDLSCIYRFDGVVSWVSGRWEEELGLPADVMIGTDFAELIHPEDVELSMALFQVAVNGDERTQHLENRHRTADGEYRHLVWSWVVDPVAKLLYAIARDVTEQKVADLRLAESEAQYRLMAEHSSDAITVSSRAGVFDYVSPAGHSVFGWRPQEMVGREIYEFIHSDDVEGLRVSLHHLLSDPSVSMISARFRRSDGTYRWLESTGRQIRDRNTGDLLAVIGNTRDVTTRRTEQDALTVQAQTDPLTGTANRTVLMDRMQGALLRLDRTPGTVAVLLLDLDRFKRVNDSLGHRAGDEVLVASAERLVAACRPTDSVARYGGDEFVVLAEGLTSAEDVHELAERLVAALREPFQVTGPMPGDDEQILLLTVSVGVAVTTRADHLVGDLMQEADLALYRAKDRGRDRHELFDDELQARALRRLGTQRTLRRALAAQDMYLLYQPIVRISDGRVLGAEGLLRVRDGAGGVLSPGEFRTVAEETGLIRDLDAWMLRQTLADQVTFLAADESVFVGVNLSYRNVSDGRLAEWITSALADAGLPGSALRVELTERALLDTAGPSVAGVQRLRNAGVKVGLDDFGTGYSSLSSLQRLPLDFLKIDRSLVQDAVPGSRQAAIIRAVVGLAHAYDLEVIAEGVESAEQLTGLEQVGCDGGQGWLFSHPLEAADYRRLLLTQCRSARTSAVSGDAEALDPPTGVQETAYPLRRTVGSA